MINILHYLYYCSHNMFKITISWLFFLFFFLGNDSSLTLHTYTTCFALIPECRPELKHFLEWIVSCCWVLKYHSFSLVLAGNRNTLKHHPGRTVLKSNPSLNKNLVRATTEFTVSLIDSPVKVWAILLLPGRYKLFSRYCLFFAQFKFIAYEKNKNTRMTINVFQSWNVSRKHAARL